MNNKCYESGRNPGRNLGQVYMEPLVLMNTWMEEENKKKEIGKDDERLQMYHT